MSITQIPYLAWARCGDRASVRLRKCLTPPLQTGAGLQHRRELGMKNVPESAGGETRQ
jgi:hypothetical protein